MRLKTISKKIYYKIAGHLLLIEDEIGLEIDRCLWNFLDFKTSYSSESPILLIIKLRKENLKLNHNAIELLSDVSGFLNDRFRFERSDELYYTRINGVSNSTNWIMQSSNDFKESVIYIDEEDVYKSIKLSWLIMVAFGQSSISQHTLLIHASAMEYNNFAYAFLGRSGTGKSTHSRIWMEHIKGSKLINDDQPAIRVFPDGEVHIYGTPWSGKTNCFLNKRFQLAGITRLEQAESNNFYWKDGLETMLTLLPSVTAIRWNNDLYNNMLNILESIIKKVPIGHLECLPNKEAAEIHLKNYLKCGIIN